ncbi:MAG: ATP-binding protein [Desulfobacteraceae bacterium]|nr:ATP-binding protein [Desulfobacteraceae bacterium]
MKRTAEKRLGQWLKNIRRKPLVIRGARQVGKSTLVRQFAEKNNHEINLERYPKLTNVFASHDTDRLPDTSLWQPYRDDFAKYATHADLLRLHRVFDYIPISAGNRIKYARIDQREQARDLRRALDLLEKAQVVMKAYHTDASGIPVLASDQRKFKTFFMDCGLMNSMCGIQWISPDDLKTKDFINKGRVAEQFVAQHIAFSGKNNKRPSLAYWLREGRSSNAEVDFVLQMGQSVIPVKPRRRTNTCGVVFRWIFICAYPHECGVALLPVSRELPILILKYLHFILV